MIQITPANKKILQEVFLSTGRDLGVPNLKAAELEFEAYSHEGMIQIDTNNPNMTGYLNVNTGVLEVINLANKDTKNNSKTLNLIDEALQNKYKSSGIKKLVEDLSTNEDGRPQYYWQLYFNDENTYVFRGVNLARDIDFDGHKPLLQVFLNTLPQGSKDVGVSTEMKYNSTSYNYEPNGAKLSFSSVDNEHFYIWGNFGKGAIYTGESFKLSEIDDFKLDVDALKSKFAPKAEEKGSSDRESARIPKDNRPYDLSLANIKKIDSDGPVSTRWGRYKGDRHEIFGAVVWAAKEAKVNSNHLVAFIEHESGFNPNTKSPTGAEGLGQFTSGTWNDMVNKYPVRRDGEKHNGLRDAYPELDWGQGTENRQDIVLNALATAHYMRYNMNQRDSDDRNVGYISHNLGPGGCNQFMRNLDNNPHSKCSGDALIKYNPINYTNRGDPLTYRQAYNRIDSHMDNSYGMAVQRGYNPDLAEEAIRGQETQVNNQPAKPKDNSTSQIGEDLLQSGMQEYQGIGVLPQEVMDKALAMAQQNSAKFI